MTDRILIVEDSRTQAELLRVLLTGEGYEVDVALTGREGLAKAMPVCPALIISDVTMPEMDGFELCRALRASEITRHVPIILLTAMSSPADIIKGLEHGADNFIPKPYNDVYLLERIRRIFEQLKHRERGRLEMEVNMTVGGRRITVTADRQQIMELLFSTIEEVSKNHDELTLANKELRAARAEADRANMAKSQFLSRMSHELRTPLNAVMGFGQLLEMANLEEEDHESAVQILAAGAHLLDLITELLDIGRIDAGDLALSIVPVSVDEVIKEAVDLVRPLAKGRDLDVRSDFAGGGMHVLADRHRLKQVVINLLSNAVKYNRQGGTITLRCGGADSRTHRMEFTDTGRGIAPENMDRVFAPFDRVGAEKDGLIEGTGLGLALSRRLVDAMGGSLGVNSVVGSGSTFWVELPSAKEPSTG